MVGTKGLIHAYIEEIIHPKDYKPYYNTKNMEIKQLTKTIENASQILKENNDLKKQNISLISRINNLEHEIDKLNKELKKDQYINFTKGFESNPSSYLDLPINEILSNDRLFHWYFKSIYKYMEYSKTLRVFFETTDSELLALPNLGKEKLKKIRLIQDMIYNNKLKRIF